MSSLDNFDDDLADLDLSEFDTEDNTLSAPHRAFQICA